jgi:predicted phage baseplate assembly protein
MSEREPALCSCGCCTGAATGPIDIVNAPGQRAVRYRTGTASSFLAAMQAAAEATTALHALRARKVADPAVALMDSWSLTLDVLSFYNERLANEGYLRTATEQISLIELARTVGYERGPGRSADVLLAFTIDDGGSLPPVVTVPMSTQVASLPGPGEAPQTFETNASLDARVSWNSMAARTALAGGPGKGDVAIYLPGTVTDVRPGDVLLFVGRATALGMTSAAWTTRHVAHVVPVPYADVTLVSWSDPLPSAMPDPADISVHVFRQRASLFGYNAPDWRTMSSEIQGNFLPPLTHAVAAVAGDSIVVGRPGKHVQEDWPGFEVVSPAANTLDLDAAYPKLAAGSWLVVETPTGSPQLFRVTEVRPFGQTRFGLSQRTTRVVVDRPIPAALNGTRRSALVLTQSESLTLASVPVTDPVQGDTVELSEALPAPPSGRDVIVTGRSPRLRVAEGVFDQVLQRPTGTTRVLHPGEVLTVTAPFEQHADSSRTWPVVTIDGDAGRLTAPLGALEPLPADPAQPILVEAARIAEQTAATAADRSVTRRLELAGKLRGCFDRGTLRVLANVVGGTHGETRHEVLGSGDATVPFQRFVLAQAPLTYAPGPGVSGVVSSLVIVVDDVRWKEVASFDNAGAADRVYTVRADDTGKVTVRFGDGVNGARLPTGEQNVSATYRVGIGRAGRLDGGRLTLLLTRPLGVRSVTNPLPTGLAADPDDPEMLRRHAPSAALAIDRVVSVTDYEDFARQRPGIAKATARSLRRHGVAVVHLSVAGDDGQLVDDPACAELATALKAAGDPRLPISVDPIDIVTFDVAVDLVVDPAGVSGSVKRAVRSVLLTTFGFDRREVGQPVAASEVMALAQGVEGVVAANVRKLYLSGSTAELRPVLGVPVSSIAASEVAPVRLLLVRSEGLTLVETS